MSNKLKLPKFEIEDLCLPESDPLYPNAVQCVKTYWKQAIVMSKKQRQKYLWYLQGQQIKNFVKKPFESEGGEITAHSLYQRARDDEGNFVLLSWPAFLLLSSLYGDVPQRYQEAIAKKYGTSNIEDYTTIYRHFYPGPTCTKAKVKMESAPKSALARETAGEPTATDTRTGIKSEHKDDVETKTPLAKDRDQTRRERRDRSSAPTPTQSIDVWATPKKLKRSSSDLESSPKRTKLGSDEISNHANEHTEVTKWIIDIYNAQLDQNSMLHDIRYEMKQTAQDLNDMYDGLQKFMLGIASGFKAISDSISRDWDYGK